MTYSVFQITDNFRVAHVIPYPQILHILFLENHLPKHCFKLPKTSLRHSFFNGVTMFAAYSGGTMPEIDVYFPSQMQGVDSTPNWLPSWSTLTMSFSTQVSPLRPWHEAAILPTAFSQLWLLKSSVKSSNRSLVPHKFSGTSGTSGILEKPVSPASQSS